MNFASSLNGADKRAGFSSAAGISGARLPADVGVAAQSEMPNPTSFSEVPAARVPRFGDSGRIKAAKLVRSTLRPERDSSCALSKEVRIMSLLPTRECQYERRVSDLSDRGAKSVNSLNPHQNVPTPSNGEDIQNGL